MARPLRGGMVVEKFSQPSNSNNSYYFTLDSSKMTLVTANGGSGYSTFVSWSPSTGTWYHIAVTKTGTTVNFYVNGSQQGTTQTIGSSGINDSNSTFVIGSDAGNGDFFDGRIDDVRVWTRALSSTDISNLYTSPGTFGNGASFGGEWLFENNGNDSSGNSNNLTNNNSATFSTDVAYTGSSVASTTHSYAGTGYANPDAPTTVYGTTLAYDNNGNLTSYGTSTYAYDHNGNRVSQTTGYPTTLYPNKYYSVVSTMSGATTTATSTEYIWAGDTLVSYIEQALINGTATGTPSTYYVHPDHLGSTNVVSNASGTVVTAKDYYPYGSVRVNSGN